MADLEQDTGRPDSGWYHSAPFDRRLFIQGLLAELIGSFVLFSLLFFAPPTWSMIGSASDSLEVATPWLVLAGFYYFTPVPHRNLSTMKGLWSGLVIFYLLMFSVYWALFGSIR